MSDQIERNVARKALRTAYELLGEVAGAGEARGHVLWALGVFGSADDRAYVKQKNEEMDARLDQWRGEMDARIEQCRKEVVL